MSHTIVQSSKCFAISVGLYFEQIHLQVIVAFWKADAICYIFGVFLGMGGTLRLPQTSSQLLFVRGGLKHSKLFHFKGLGDEASFKKDRPGWVVLLQVLWFAIMVYNTNVYLSRNLCDFVVENLSLSVYYLSLHEPFRIVFYHDFDERDVAHRMCNI